MCPFSESKGQMTLWHPIKLLTTYKNISNKKEEYTPKVIYWFIVDHRPNFENIQLTQLGPALFKSYI